MSSAALFPSRPSLPPSDYDGSDLPVVSTNQPGMIVDEHAAPSRRKKQQDVKVVRKSRKPRKYHSKHFTQGKPTKRNLRERSKVRVESSFEDGNDESSSLSEDVASTTTMPAPEQLPEPLPPKPRICYGLNLDELSSDSDLTDVPSDIGPDPFPSDHSESDLVAVKVKSKKIKKTTSTATKRHPTKSPYFPSASIAHRHRQHFLTTLPFPPLTSTRFGLMQERLAHDPFRLLIATIFLNKTPGERAMPIFFDLMKRYPTPLALSQAHVPDVTEIIRTLGFQNQRARKCVAMATAWEAAPPTRTKRYRKLNYPCKGDGRDVKEGEIVADEDDTRVAWEISHLPGLGPYSHDSWRMFCRDELLGRASDWLGGDAVSTPARKGADPGPDRNEDQAFEPEWKRVLPQDKELRAWMTWMWLKEGWIWNKETGEKTKADEELLRMARDGGVVQETAGDQHLVVKGLEQESVLDIKATETPAGEFMG